MDPITTRIESSVIAQLGMPGQLHDVQIKKISSDSYRVNVRCYTLDGETCVIKTIRIAHSYYVTVSPGGEIISSSPAIKTKYR